VVEFGKVKMSLLAVLEENTPRPETFKIPPLSLSILFPSVLAPVNFGKKFVVPVPVIGFVIVFLLLILH
jgi:hypothetical protein